MGLSKDRRPLIRAAVLRYSRDMTQTIHIVGGGLAGSEAAWQVAEAGHRAVIHEMRPVRMTP